MSEICSECGHRSGVLQFTLDIAEPPARYLCCSAECLITLINRLDFTDASCSYPCYGNSICDDCAKEAGGRWPDGHMATSWIDECSVCGEPRKCCAKSDWLWGKQEKLPVWD
jgi:hypothetical protein